MERDFPQGFDNNLPREQAHAKKHRPQMTAEAALPTNVAQNFCPSTPLDGVASETADRIVALDDFACHVASAVEIDYGDWMRRVNAYYLELSEKLAGANSEVDRLLNEIHLIVQYDPDWYLVETRRRVIKLTMELRQLLGAPNGPDVHEYGLSETVISAEPS